MRPRSTHARLGRTCRLGTVGRVTVLGGVQQQLAFVILVVVPVLLIAVPLLVAYLKDKRARDTAERPEA